MMIYLTSYPAKGQASNSLYHYLLALFDSTQMADHEVFDHLQLVVILAKNQKRPTKDSGPQLPHSSLYRQSLQKESWTTCQKTASLPSKHVSSSSKTTIMVMGREKFREDSKVATKNLPRDKVTKLYYIKAKKTYISLISSLSPHTHSNTRHEHTHKTRGLRYSLTFSHRFLGSLLALIS